METPSISRKELRKIIRETFIDALVDNKGLIEDAVVQAMEDLGLARAMEEGRTGEYVDAKEFKRKLNSRLKRSR